MAGVAGAGVLFGILRLSRRLVRQSSQVDAIVVSRQPHRQEGPASAYAGVFRGHP